MQLGRAAVWMPVVLLALMAVGAWLSWWSGPPVAPLFELPAEAPSGSTRALIGPLPEPEAGAPRDPVVALTPRLTVTGRVLYARARTPVTGAVVELAPRPTPSRLLASRVVATARPDADGTFHLDVPTNTDHRYDLCVTVDGVRYRHDIPPQTAGDADYDAGALVVGSAFTVAGSVLAADGRAVPGVRFRLVRRQSAAFAREDFDQRGMVQITANGAGGFVTPTPLTEGTWHVTGDDCEIVRAPPIRIDSGGVVPAGEITVVVEMPALILGRVTSVEGVGLGGMQVLASAGARHRQAVSAANGEFELRWPGSGPISSIEVTDPRGEYPRTLRTGAWTVEDAPLRIVLERGGTVAIAVVDGRTGAGIAGCRVKVLRSAGARARATDQSVATTGAEGVVVVDRLAGAEVLVAVGAAGTGFADSGLVRVRTDAGSARIALSRPRHRITVIDDEGRPVAGAGITVCQPLASLGLPGKGIHGALTFDTLTPVATGLHRQLQVAAGRTGESGEIVVGDAGGRGLVLQVHAPGCGLVRVDPWQPVPGRTTIVRLSPSGRILGRIRDWSGASSRARVVAFDGDRWVPAFEGPQWEVKPDGAFECRGLNQGEWELWLVVEPQHGLTGEVRLRAASVEVRSGQVHRTEIELPPALRWQEVMMTVSVDGAPFWGRMMLAKIDAAQPGRPILGRVGPLWTTRQGTLTATLLPGAYVATLHGAGDAAPLRVSQVYEVGAATGSIRIEAAADEAGGRRE